MPDNSDKQDPFALLGLPARFDLDAADIERAYLAKAARLHPDLVGGDEAAAARASAELNRAKRILGDHERRAIALLTLLGGPVAAQDKSLPDGFLMDILELREQVESARDSGDPAQVARWEAWAADERARYSGEMSQRFASLSDPPTPAALSEIRTQLNAWRYIERLIEQLDPAYDPARADFSDGG